MEDKKIYGIKKDIVLMYFALIVLGLVFLIFPKASTESICYIIAASLVIWGGARLRGYFRASRFSIFGSYGLVQGSLLVLGGAMIFIKPEILAGVIMTIIGCILIADGILKVQYSVDLLRIKGEAWWILAVIAALLTVSGVVVILDPFGSAVALMRFTGAFLVVSGIIDLAAIVYISKKISAIKKAMETGTEIQ